LILQCGSRQYNLRQRLADDDHFEGQLVTNWYVSTFSHLLLDIEAHLKDYLHGRPEVAPLFWEMVDYHFGWQRSVNSSAAPNIGGKRIRPLLLLVVARALCGRTDHAMPAALALEIIHNFTLIHDDVMDESVERRHRKTLWVKWGRSQAINAGDGLYSLGMSAALSLRDAGVPADKALTSMQLILDACLATVEGQMLDVGFEQRTDVTPDEYLTMIGGKTGALIETSARIGALLSTDDDATVDAYAAFGLNLGLAFQIWDDYLGVWGDAERTGKSATSDIEGRKKSYPVLLAFQSAAPDVKADLHRIYAQSALSTDDVQTVLDALETVDAQQKTRELIEVYFQRALTALDSVHVDNDDQRSLRDLALFLVERAY
jgi:geranylgeranyl diphosphate synthase type I